MRGRGEPGPPGPAGGHRQCSASPPFREPLACETAAVKEGWGSGGQAWPRRKALGWERGTTGRIPWGTPPWPPPLLGLQVDRRGPARTGEDRTEALSASPQGP